MCKHASSARSQWRRLVRLHRTSASNGSERRVREKLIDDNVMLLSISGSALDDNDGDGDDDDDGRCSSRE